MVEETKRTVTSNGSNETFERRRERLALLAWDFLCEFDVLHPAATLNEAIREAYARVPLFQRQLRGSDETGPVDWEAEYKKLAGVYTREGLEQFIASHWPGNALVDASETGEQLKVGDPVSLTFTSPFGIEKDGWVIKALPKPSSVYVLTHPNGGEVCAERFGFNPTPLKALEQPSEKT